MKNILITGCAGFIGFHITSKLLKKGYRIYGIDILTKSYDINLKKLRLKKLKNKNFYFKKLDISSISKGFKKVKFDLIIHLAAEAGVRSSLSNPYLFIKQNITKTVELFEYAKKNKIKKIFYASSSSVYGDKYIFPTPEKIHTNQPISIYGLTKITCENIAYYYYKIFKISSLGFRFFTVFGEYGRPDMSMYIFIKAILRNNKIILNNYGNNFRDYTYIDDLVNYIESCIKKIKFKNYFFNIFNIGGQKNIRLIDLVKKIEKISNKKARIVLRRKISLDPISSLATTKKLENFLQKRFNSNFEDSLRKTFLWIKNYIE